MNTARHHTQKSNCYFKTDMTRTYITTTYRKDRPYKAKYLTPRECYHCSNLFFIKKKKKKKIDRNIKCCSSIPGITYLFNTETLEAFEIIFFFKNDISFMPYYDFETIAMGDFDVESDKIFPASYVLVFVCYQDLHYDMIVIQKSYGHSLEKLCNIPYCPGNLSKYRDQATTAQLKDVTLRVSKQKFKKAISEMSCTELKFVNDCL